jgi:hypothetical protein
LVGFGALDGTTGACTVMWVTDLATANPRQVRKTVS